MAGRPTKLTPEAQQRIVKAIELGLTYERSAKAAGISEQTLITWRKRGARATRGIYFEFLEALKKAEIHGEMRNLLIIEKAASKGSVVTETKVTKDADGKIKEQTTITRELAPQWQPAAWILERRYRDRWGRNIVIDVEDLRPMPLFGEGDGK